MFLAFLGSQASAFSPDGRFVAILTESLEETKPEAACKSMYWMLQSGAVLKTKRFSAPFDDGRYYLNSTFSLIFSPDGSQILLTREGETAGRLFEREELTELRVERNPIWKN
jgi:hypothetical protein